MKKFGGGGGFSWISEKREIPKIQTCFLTFQSAGKAPGHRALSLCYMVAATFGIAFPDSFIADLLPVGTILHSLLPARSIFLLAGSRCTPLASLRIGPFNP